jgi:hypothetical protein
MAKVWHYKDAAGQDVIKLWADGVPKPQRIKLQAKIDMLIEHGSTLPPQLLADTGVPGIKKIKVQGNPKLRPLLCMTTENPEEYVLLVGAYEISWEYVPKDALTMATERREEVLKDAERKTPHVRFIKKQ